MGPTPTSVTLWHSPLTWQRLFVVPETICSPGIKHSLTKLHDNCMKTKGAVCKNWPPVESQAKWVTAICSCSWLVSSISRAVSGPDREHRAPKTCCCFYTTNTGMLVQDELRLAVSMLTSVDISPQSVDQFEYICLWFQQWIILTYCSSLQQLDSRSSSFHLTWLHLTLRLPPVSSNSQILHWKFFFVLVWTNASTGV